MSDETILVTGGAGYIGSHLVRKLLDRGFRVRVLDSFLYGDTGLRELRENSALEVIEGNICDEKDIQRAVEGVQVVVALAALVGDAACDIDPDETMNINFESTQLMLASCQSAGVRRLVFASSCSVYGANGSELLNESSELNPVSLYARTRIMSEDLLIKQRGDLEVIILRLSTVCGLSPRMRFDLMVNTITARAMVDGAVRIIGSKQWRPHIHVQDAAAAFMLAAVDAPADAARGGIYNAGGESQNFTVGEIADKVLGKLPDTNIEYVDEIQDQRSYRVSFEGIQNALGFVPSWTVDDAIDEIRNALSSGLVTNHHDEVYHNFKYLQRALQRQAS